MRESIGQILPGSQFGDLLTELARRAETILEIGTWHGGGSTVCLANGLVRPAQRMWSVELDKQCWQEARRLHRREDRIRFLRANTVDILDELPASLDLVLFDGGDETTDREFDLLAPRLKVAALDDTNERKNKRQLALVKEWKWWRVSENSQDRNGWAVYSRL